MKLLTSNTLDSINTISGIGPRKIIQLDSFRKEILLFPLPVREDLFSLIDRYLKGERLDHTRFKTFKIAKNIKIQEFKVKDSSGNWRVISCLQDKQALVLVYAFHKKSQKLLQKDLETILKRIQRAGL
jgi:phage-related protein